MGDFNRKVDKFIKAKIALDKKNRALSPHLTIVASPTSLTTTATKKGGTSRNFSMTVSFFNPRFDNSRPKDHIIYHESGKQKQLATCPDIPKSPKRDPILQNNQEPTKEFRPTVKRTEQSGKTTLFSEEEPAPRMKLPGEFNDVHHVRSVSPKIEKIRTNIAPVRERSPEHIRRARKEVKSIALSVTNPITEGDPKGIKPRKERVQPGPSEDLKKMNDRKVLLSSELGASPKGKVFRDTNIVFGENVDPVAQNKSNSLRFSSPQAKRDGIKGVIEYEYSLRYRDQNVTQKCNKLLFSDLVKATEV